MGTPKRIRKNSHKIIAKMFANAKTATSYSMDNDFRGTEVSVKWVYNNSDFGITQYWDYGNGVFQVKIHQGLWYVLRTEEAVVK